MNYAEDRIDRANPKQLEERLRKAQNIIVQEYKDDCNSNGNNTCMNTSTTCTESLKKVLEAHVTAANVLRDMGKNFQACFHYAVAWGYNKGNAFRVGDYAQMAEMCGYPELGIMAIYHYRCGGNPTLCTRYSSDDLGRGCGCGLYACGQMTGLIVPFLNLLKKSNSFETEASRWFQTKFWEDEIKDDAADSESDPNKTKDSFPIRKLSPLLQLLLLKLLYCYSGGSTTFLKLSCRSIPYFTNVFMTSTRLNYRMLASGKKHKSHWAYYVLIRAIIDGKKMKPHRRVTLPYHVPIKDIMSAVDIRWKNNLSPSEHSEDNVENDQELIRIFKSLLHDIHFQSEARHQPIASTNVSPIPFIFNSDSNFKSIGDIEPMFVCGDSHVLSLAWQLIRIPTSENSGKFRLLHPLVITGLKAWHCRDETKFFTHSNLHNVLKRLRIRKPTSQCVTIIFSAGEIDCREGIGGSKLEGYYTDCDTAVVHTVRQYVAALKSLALQYNLQILVMPVAPHAYRSKKNGKHKGRDARRARTVLWNRTLDEELEKNATNVENRVHFLNYWKQLSSQEELHSDSYVLDKYYNADFTHMNSAFLPLLEKSIEQSKINKSVI